MWVRSIGKVTGLASSFVYLIIHCNGLGGFAQKVRKLEWISAKFSIVLCVSSSLFLFQCIPSYFIYRYARYIKTSSANRINRAFNFMGNYNFARSLACMLWKLWTNMYIYSEVEHATSSVDEYLSVIGMLKVRLSSRAGANIE